MLKIRLAMIAMVALASTPAWTDPVAAQDPDGYVVVVLPFASPDDGKSKDLQKKVVAEMNELGQYTLIELKAVNDALQKAGLRPGAPIPSAQALEIARDLDARIVAHGQLENRGGQWTANATFVDVATRNAQELPAVAAGGVDEVGEKLVEVFNNRNQAIKHVIFGQDYVRSENFDRAITNFQQALEYDPSLASAYYYIGDVQLRRGNTDQALTSLQKAVEIDPAYINAYHTIGLAYVDKGDTAAARNFFEQLIQKNPGDCDTQIAYGYVMANELGEVEKGLAAFEKAKQLCPDNPLAYQYLAFALPEDRREQKIENFKKYLELSEGKATDPEALQYLFGLYFAEERYDDARQMIDQVLAADPNDAQLQMYAGITRFKLEQYREAIDYFTKALEINPELEDAYLNRALAYQRIGDMAAYARDLEKAGHGRSGEILAGMALRDAHQLLRSGRAGAALEAVNRAAALGGDRCAIAYYRGDAYYQMGKGLQGESASVAQNERSIQHFRTAINHLQDACGTYSSYASGLINNANQYIERGELIIKKLNRTGR